MTDNGLTKRMRADLLVGEFEHGQWLRLVELEKRYGVSRSEVRKSLAALAAIGALEHHENQGYRLPEADPQKDEQYRETRLVLELGAGPKVFHRATLNDLARLFRLAERFAAVIDDASLAEAQGANNDFHRAFFELCGNPILARTINDMRELVQPYSPHVYATPEQRQASANEHFEMLYRIEAKDLNGLLDTMRRHLYRVSRLQPGNP